MALHLYRRIVRSYVHIRVEESQGTGCFILGLILVEWLAEISALPSAYRTGQESQDPLSAQCRTTLDQALDYPGMWLAQVLSTTQTWMMAHMPSTCVLKGSRLQISSVLSRWTSLTFSWIAGDLFCRMLTQDACRCLLQSGRCYKRVIERHTQSLMVPVGAPEQFSSSTQI